MARVIRIQYSLPNGQFLDKLLTDDLILRYVKDGYQQSEHCVEYYDTGDWALAEGGFALGVTRAQEIPVVRLTQGQFGSGDFPGLYRGQEWIAPYLLDPAPEASSGGGNATFAEAVPALLERGAPPPFGELAAGRALTRCFFTLYASKSTTLYLPDRTRVEMGFQSGELVAEDKRLPLYELSLELLFGDEGLLCNYCEQIRERFALPPLRLTRQQTALRLLRSR